jgi:hypothetical protein
MATVKKRIVINMEIVTLFENEAVQQAYYLLSQVSAGQDARKANRQP